MTADVIDIASKTRRSKRDSNRRSEAKRQHAVAKAGYTGMCVFCDATFPAPKKGLLTCGPGYCLQGPLGQTKLKPGTLQHFELWASFVELDNGEPWTVERFQADFLKDVFAGVPETWLLIAEGNTKTTTLGGLGLYHLQFTPYGRVPVAAASKDQASELHSQAQGMVERSEILRPVFDCHEGLKEIRCAWTYAKMKVYASDDRTGDGAIFTLALVDELHRHKDLRLYRTWAGKRYKRGGQLCGISTAGEPGSEFEETRDRIRAEATTRKQRGKCYARYANDNVVMHEFCIPPKSNHEDLKLVKQANPFSGITLETLADKRKSPTMTLSWWKRVTCNVASRGDTAAITEQEWWDAKLDVELPIGFPCWAGLDVAWKWDTTALVPMYVFQSSDVDSELFPLHYRRMLLKLYGIPKAKNDEPQTWPDDGFFRLLGSATILDPPRDGTMLDPDLVEEALLRLHERNPIHTLVMDMSKAEQLAVWAERELGCDIVDRTQSNQMAVDDYNRWTEAMREKWLWHTGDQALAKHVFNAVAKVLPRGDTRFDRPARSRQVSNTETASRRVIDALTAASMVHSVAAENFDLSSGGLVYAEA